MAQVKVGDHVHIADREPNPNDSKSGLFYGYFRNLTGVIERVYEDNTVCIDVNIDSLPDDVRIRHKEMETAARDKWIGGLSQEQRSRLTERDKQFTMSYKVVVSAADVNPAGKGPAKNVAKTAKAEASSSSPEKPVSAPAKPAPSESSEPSVEQQAAKAVGKPKPAATAAAAKKPEKGTPAAPKGAETEPAPKRVTAKDLSTAEREYLESLKAKRPEA
ncbi:MAG: hypothetical protein Q7T82_06405 [Armatimonadota bacterium]|nr:hypothetical protein [Armatimonadota bacterium]